MMTQITDATFEDGVLKPERDLHLRPKERVRLIVQQLGDVSGEAREQAIRKLFATLDRIGFKSQGRTPRAMNCMNAIDTNVLLYAVTYATRRSNG